MTTTTLRSLASFTLMLFGFVLVIGGGNWGTGVHVPPQPLLGLLISGLGLAMWVWGFRIGHTFSWARTYLWAIQVLLALTVVVLLRNAMEIDSQESGIGPVLFAGGFALLACLCYLVLRRISRGRNSTSEESS